MAWILAGSFRAGASVQVCTDESAFLAATGATSASGEIPDLGRVTGAWSNSILTVSRLPRASALYLGGEGRLDSPLRVPAISVEGFTNLRLEPGLPAYSLGFQFAEAGPGSSGVGGEFVDSVFEVTLWSGTVRVGRVQFNATNDVVAFFGLASTRAFDRLELVEIEGSADREWLGRIHVSRVAIPVVVPESGDVIDAFAELDRALKEYLDESCYPGLTAAVGFGGRLVYRRSFGWKDYLRTAPLDHSTPMLLGSCSKPITATVILNLIRAGRIHGTNRMIDVLGLRPPPGMNWVAGFGEITVDQLLAHKSGLVRSKPSEGTVGTLLGLGRPASFSEALAWAGTQPLLFVPGSSTSYSNFGYGVLGAIAEAVEGRRYEKQVAELCGGMFAAKSVGSPNAEPHTTPDVPGVPPYTWYLNNTAAGGLAASAPDYCRFLRAFRLTGAPRAGPVPTGNFNFTFAFHGSVDEAMTVARQRHSRGFALDWVVFCNDRGYLGNDELDARVAAQVLAITNFPAHDHFPYLNWKLGWFWNSSLGVVVPEGGDHEDPDRDGIDNAMEYVLRRGPKLAELDPVPVRIARGGSPGAVEVRYRRPADRPDVAVELERSGNLQDWSVLARSVEGGVTGVAGGRGETVSEVLSGLDWLISVRLESAAEGAEFHRIRAVP
jgi:CubicO group peptidase (beta-lactamase class C family)